MHAKIASAATLLALSAAARPAAGAEVQLAGEVVQASARWTADRSTIVTESVVRTSDGRLVRVRQLGGSVSGIGMVQSHAPAPLALGDRVVARAVRHPNRETLSLLEVLSRQPALPEAPELEGAIPFVRTRNDSGAALYWDRSCVFMTYDAAGTSDVPGAEEFAVLDSSFAAWESGASCSFLSFRFTSPEEQEVGFDRVNLVKFREQRWCRPASGGEPEECYDPSAAGITTLFFIDDASSDRNGEIVDADIELNAVDFAISVDGETLGPGGLCDADLGNTATHEIGHLVGLDHTCYSGIGSRPVNNEGQPIPDCTPRSDLSSEVVEATMFNFQECGETKKRSLEADDIDGICAIYPVGESPGVCRPPGGEGGCCTLAASTVDRSGGPLGFLFVLAALAGLLAARRRY